jgi:hypothetical protein
MTDKFGNLSDDDGRKKGSVAMTTYYTRAIYYYYSLKVLYLIRTGGSVAAGLGSLETQPLQNLRALSIQPFFTKQRNSTSSHQ